jgi:hypothetical protein
MYKKNDSVWIEWNTYYFINAIFVKSENEYACLLSK